MTESKAIPKSDTSTLGEKGQTTIPKEHREFISAETGDHVSWTAKEEGNERFLMVKRVILPALAILVCSLAFLQGSAFAQVTPTNANATAITTLPQTTTTTDTVESITFAADAARFPVRVEFTFPTGINPIWNISKLSVNSVYGESGTVGAGGVTTKTWTTGMSDTFTIRFGEHYPVPIDQIAKVSVYSNNTQVVPTWVIPIKGDSFVREIKLITTPAPHTPTPEELAAPVTARLDALTQKVDIIDQRTSQQDVTIGLTAQVFQGGIFIVIMVAAILGAATLAIFIVYRKFKHLELPKEELGIGGASA